jgi:general secretion pathway protein A
MYRQLFGFSKNPFRQTPDPAYLFLGQHHEEAIAHLSYAVMKGEGFSVITGERGVGKTTVCRSFLEQLDHNVQSAYIFDAGGISPLKLLQLINARLHIPGKFNNIKDLTDALNKFLIRKTRTGKKVALFIDDAHVLSNDVLEQVRLLSNLETTRHKLLQIILIGRPELLDRLESRELRQIGQRVSVNWYIKPLSYEETLAYVQHRISVSSKGPPVRFVQSAIHPLYRFTDGIPRRINSACDRILKEAYDHRERIIDEKIAKSALKKLSGHRSNPSRSVGLNWRAFLLYSGGTLALIAMVSGAYIISTNHDQRPDTIVVSKQIAPLSEPQTASEPKAESESAVPKKDDGQLEGDPVVEELTDAILESSFAGGEVIPEPEAATPEDNIADPIQPESVGAVFEDSPPQRMTHSIQVGAFLEEENARRLVKRLKDSGYLPQIITVQSPDGLSWFSVRVGDYPSIDIALQKAAAFTAVENLAAAVRPYNAF